MKLDEKRWKKVRKQALRRDRYRCKRCGSTRKLHVHHIKMKCMYPHLAYTLSNLVVLCEKCHIAWHKKHGYGRKKKKNSNKRFRPTHRTAPIRVVYKPKKRRGNRKYKVKVRR